MAASELPAQVLAWLTRGRFQTVLGRAVFVVDLGDTERPTVLLVHGFPGSSFDWHKVVEKLVSRYRVVLVDLLGFGLSDKPTDARYSLYDQADLVEAVAAEAGVFRCSLVGHDMGDTVIAELLHRHNAGLLGFTVDGVVLTNGSIFIDLVRLSRGQRLLLALPDRRLPLPLPVSILRASLASTFSPDRPPEPGTLDALARLTLFRGGGRLLSRQVRYIGQRRRNQPRWTAALVDYPGRLTVVWGELDPIAGMAMPRRLAELRPGTTVITWPDIAHWPSLEAPDRLTEVLIDFLG